MRLALGSLESSESRTSFALFEAMKSKNPENLFQGTNPSTA